MSGFTCVQAPHASHVGVPHAAGPPLTVHVIDSTIGVMTHVPPAHIGVVVMRVFVPVVPHVAPTMQSEKGVVTVAPHDAPSVDGRVHIIDSGASTAMQLPPMQCDVVFVRVMVPVVVQGSVPNEQSVQSPVVGAAHMLPSVDARVHICEVIVVVAAHAPAVQVNVMSMRVCVPEIAHKLPPKLHGPGVPMTGAGQSATVTQPTHMLREASQCVAPVHGSPAC